MTTPLALIVGSGPTGMTMAIELKKAGLDARIIDKANHTAPHSQALVLQARSLEQFQRYGIADTAVQRGKKLTKAMFWSEGKQILSFALDKIPSRYPYVLFLPQSETENILREKMEALGIQTEREVELVAMREEMAEKSRLRRAGLWGAMERTAKCANWRAFHLRAAGLACRFSWATWNSKDQMHRMMNCRCICIREMWFLWAGFRKS